jgi:hypothetical protein
MSEPNETDDLLITNARIGEVQFQVRWATRGGGGVEYLVNTRQVQPEIYDRILATVKARSLDELATAFHPDGDDGILSELRNIYCAINENSEGNHPLSLVEAIGEVAAAVRDRE